MKGLVCAGGEATRLGELTRVTNKHLLPVGSWPMVYYPLQLLQLAGIREVLVVTGKGHAGQMIDLLGDGHLTVRGGDAPLLIRIVLMLVGVLIIGIGSGFYIGAGMGAGPRDSLMLVVARRAGIRIGVSRVAIEVLVTVVGFAFGGTVGIGTLVFAFGIGPAVELSFWLLERSPLADPAPNLSHAA